MREEVQAGLQTGFPSLPPWGALLSTSPAGPLLGQKPPMAHLQLEAWAGEEGFPRSQAPWGRRVGKGSVCCGAWGQGMPAILEDSWGTPVSPSRTPRGALGGPTAPE